MLQRYTFRIATGLVALAMLLPMTVHPTMAKNARTNVRTTMTFQNPVTLAGKQLKAGDYQVSADDSKVTISQHGKVVAEAPAQWKDGNGKAEYSQVVTDSGTVTEIHFQGKTRYVSFSQ